MVVTVGYSGDGKATWILSGRLEHRSTAVCFWSLRELSGTLVLCTPVSAVRPPLYLGNKGQRGFEAEICGLWKHLAFLMDSHTWVEQRHLGFVSGWEAPDCARHGGSVWEAEPTNPWVWPCSDFGFLRPLIQKHSAWGPRGQASSLQQGLVLLRNCKQPVVVRKKVFSFLQQYGREGKLEVDKLCHKSCPP